MQLLNEGINTNFQIWFETHNEEIIDCGKPIQKIFKRAYYNYDYEISSSGESAYGYGYGYGFQEYFLEIKLDKVYDNVFTSISFLDKDYELLLNKSSIIYKQIGKYISICMVHIPFLLIRNTSVIKISI